MAVLVCLASNPGALVPKGTLFKVVWPDTFVSDDVLIRAISELRRTFNDDVREPRFIETVPKRGYRLIATVTQENEEAYRTNGKIADRVESVSRTTAIGRAKRLGIVIGLGLAVLLAAILGLTQGKLRNLRADTETPEIKSLAVLPLQNLSHDPEQEYFSYGMTEQLITELAQISGLKVISHTSVIQHAKSNKSLPQIARELGVEGIVEGAVQRSGNQVRITIQLIYAPEDKHLWAESYDRDFRDTLALQRNVADAIVAHIRTQTAGAKMLPKAPSASPNLNALEAYLQGEYSVSRMGSGEGVEGYRSAISFFKQAIVEDPKFAPAYLALAQTYDAQFDWRPNEIMPLEKAAVAKALELDPGLAEAHSMNAAIKVNYDCDFQGAREEIKESLRINPNLAVTHDRFASYFLSLQRPQEAKEEAHRAQELDPGGTHEVGLFLETGQYDKAINQLRDHLELYPNDGFAYIDSGLINAYHFAGRHRESAEAMQRAWALFGFKHIGQGVGRAYATSGYAASLRYSAKQMERLYAERKVFKPDWIAQWYARAGDREQTLKWLRIALADNNYCWADLDHDLDFGFLRNDSRFQELVERSLPH